MTPGCFKEPDEDDDAEQAQQSEIPGKSPATEASRGQETDDNRNNATATDKSSAATPHRTRRTGLRRETEHASWRAVARACHVRDPEGHR
jgi:hypothetical protein